MCNEILKCSVCGKEIQEGEKYMECEEVMQHKICLKCYCDEDLRDQWEGTIELMLATRASGF